MLRDVSKKKGVLSSREVDDLFADHKSSTASSREVVEQDLHYILTDKTSGDAKAKVDAAEHGEGYHALMNLVMYYSTTGGEALNDRIRRIMSPGTPKKDEDISQALDTWLKESREVSDLGASELPLEFKITALRIIMNNHLASN